MMRRPLAKLFLTGFLALNVFSSAGCSGVFYFALALLSWLYTPYQSVSYGANLGATYYGQDGYGVAPAVVKMWEQWYNNSSSSQSAISSYLTGQGATGGSYPDVTQSQFESALQNYTGKGYWAEYGTGTCSHGKPCTTQILADISVAAHNNNPPAIIWYNYGLVTATGTTYDCLNATGCQPNHSFIKVHLPLSGYGEAYAITTAYFYEHYENVEAAPRNVFFSDSGAVEAFDTSAWENWDYFRGTFYGDPYPPDPMCPSFATHCDPEENGGGDPPENRMATPGGSGSGKYRTWDQASGVVVPYPKTRKDIIDDFVAGMKKTGLAKGIGMAPLTLEDGTLRVRNITKVRSLTSGLSDYFLLHFVDRSSGRLYARGAVGSNGLLMSVALAGDLDADDPEQAGQKAARALQKFGIHGSNPEPVHFVTTGGMPELDPSYLITDQRGRQVIFTADGVLIDQQRTTNLIAASVSTRAAHQIPTPTTHSVLNILGPSKR